MIIRIRKVFVILVVLILLLTGIACHYVGRQNEIAAAAMPVPGQKCVVIDAGHGGQDGGAVAADGTLEKELNLVIAEKLKAIFEMTGFQVFMTRESDAALCEGQFRKKEDMQNRADIANAHPDAILISVHMNNFSVAKYSGVQVFYSANHPQSEELAQTVQESVRLRLQPDNKREIKNGTETTMLLRLAQTPAILVECGFLSNPDELENLKEESYQRDLAYAIFAGVAEFAGYGEEEE